MSFVIQCECGQRMTVEDHYVGHNVVCVKCSAVLQVPVKPTDAVDAVLALRVQPGPADLRQTNLSSSVGHIPEWQGPGRTRPHRGVLLVAIGLLGCLCCPLLLPFVWAMASADLEDIRQGRMDPSGEGITSTARVIGMVGCGLLVIDIILIVLFVGLYAAKF